MRNRLIDYKMTPENLRLAEISSQACFQKSVQIPTTATSFTVCDVCSCFTDKGLGNSTQWTAKVSEGTCEICKEEFTAYQFAPVYWSQKPREILPQISKSPLDTAN
jgi:hypothetical protein